MLPEKIQTRICYTGTKLDTNFNNIKNPIKGSHWHNIVYYVACPKPGCEEYYTSEVGRRLNNSLMLTIMGQAKSHILSIFLRK